MIKHFRHLKHIPANVFLLAVICSLFTVHCPLVFSASSPVFRADYQRSGAVTEQALPRLVPQWEFYVDGGGFVSSPVTYKGVVYCGARDGCMWAWDAYTGDQLWNYSSFGWFDAPPLVSSSTVYGLSREQKIYAFDRITGEIIWEKDTESTDTSSPVLYKNSLYYVSGNPKRFIYRRDAATGELLNSYAISQFGSASPALQGDLLFYATNDGKLNCFNLDTESAQWASPVQTDGNMFYSNLACDTTSVYALVGGDERHLYSFNQQDGSVNWESVEIDTNTTAASSVAIADGTVYVVSTFGTLLRLFAFSASASGTNVDKSWSVDIGVPHISNMVSAPIISKGVIYVGSGDGCLYCIDAAAHQFYEPATGALVASATGYLISDPEHTMKGLVNSPCVSNGWVYTASFDGYMTGFKAETVTSLISPDTGDTAINNIVVQSTATNLSGSSFSIAYGQGENPSSWVTISTGTDYISSWDTTALSDGEYTARLTVDSDPVVRKAVNRFSINNSPKKTPVFLAADTSPDPGNSITLTWDKSPDDGLGNNDVIAYNIYRTTDTGFYPYYTYVSSGVTVFIDTSCANQIIYNYKVAAYDSVSESTVAVHYAAQAYLDGYPAPASGSIQIPLVVGFNSGPSAKVIIGSNGLGNDAKIGIRKTTDVPNVPLSSGTIPTNACSEFTVSPAGTQLNDVTILVYYTADEIAGITDEAALKLFRYSSGSGSWELIPSMADTTDKYVSAKVSSFSLYRVMQYALGSGTAPVAPSNLTALDTPDDSGGSISLSWTRSFDDGDGMNNITAYKIYKSSDPALVAAGYFTYVSSGITEYLDTACPINVRYYYKVTAFNSQGGESAFSNTANAYSEMDGVSVNAASGGTVSLIYEGTVTSVIIPPGALSQNALIGIKVPAEALQFAVPGSANAAAVTREFTIKPSTTVFLQNVTIKMPYTAAQTAGMNADNLRIYWGDPAKNLWRIVNTSLPETALSRVSAEIPHFSYYRIMEYVPGREDLLSADKVYTYPNPAKGDKLAFKFYLGDKADVFIDVYNIAGELIAHLTKDNNPAGITSELEWNISGIASGVYIYNVQAKSASSRKNLKKKLAVIH